MAVFLRRERWAEQPAGPVEIDQTHPLGRYAVAALTGAMVGTHDACGNAIAFTGGGIYQISRSGGRFLGHTGASSSLIFWRDKSIGNFGTDDFTVFAQFARLVDSSNGVVLGKGDTGANEWMMGGWTSADAFRFYGAAGAISLSSASSAVPLDVTRQYGAFRVAGAASTFVDGGVLSTDATASSSLVDTAHHLTLFSGDFDGTTYDNTRIYPVEVAHVVILRGVGGLDVVRALNDEPYAIYKPRVVRRYFMPSGGAEQPLSATGAANATGAATPASQVALAGVGVSLATGTAQPAGTATLAGSGSATAGGTAAPFVAIALSALGLSIATGSATISSSASGEISASGAASATGSAALVANVTISAAGLAQAAASAGLSASILLAGAGAAQAAGHAALAAQLNALAAGAAQASGSATITSYTGGQLAAAGQAQALGSAALVLDVRLAAAGAAQAGGSAALDSGNTQDLSAAGTAQADGAAQVAATVTLTGAGFVHAMGAGVLKIDIALAAVGAGRASGAAVLVPAGLAYSAARRLSIAAESRRLSVAAENRTLVIA
jgi:hypothetical protein